MPSAPTKRAGKETPRTEEDVNSINNDFDFESKAKKHGSDSVLILVESADINCL